MVKKLIKKFIYGYKNTSESYVKYLKAKGVVVGENIEIFCPHETSIDILNPHLLEIGNFVSMTGPITILTHDYSVCVLKKTTHGEIYGKQQSVKIGNNVFLGWGCCILPGTVIGDNTIIGAYSVVSGKLEENSVYAGNPARKIESLEEFYLKRKKKQLLEAVTIYWKYKERFEIQPPIELFHEYFYLFEGGDYENLNSAFKIKFYDHGNFDETVIAYTNHVPQFKSYEEFCIYAENNKI